MTKKDIVTHEELLEAQDIKSAIVLSANDDRDLVNQLLGQAQMAGASEDFFRTVRTTKLTYVKENQLYKALKGKKTPHGAEILKGTWEEFCSLLGRSVDQIDRDIANLRAFGEEALESMSKMGIGYRELRQFRKLPDDEKQALIEAAKEGDKESIADIAETIIAKQAQEKEALTKEKEELAKKLEDKTASYEQQAKLLSEKSTAIDKYKIELAKTKKHIDAMLPEDMGEELRKEAAQLVNEVELDIRGKFYSALRILAEHQEKTAIDHSALMSGFIGQLLRSINEIALNLDIKATPDSDPVPDFLRPGAMEEAMAATEQAEMEANNDL